MNIESIVASINFEIERLTTARDALTSLGKGPNGTHSEAHFEPHSEAKRGPGRPAKASSVKTYTNGFKAKAVGSTKTEKTGNKMTPEGRKRIADAMKARWAARRAEKAKSK